MLYFHNISCVSPIEGFSKKDYLRTKKIDDNKLHAIEPTYEGIPHGILRRMGKAVRISVGAALPIIQKFPELDGILIGTSNGGMEDSIKFMNQIVQYEEGLLTPGNFVQSTPNGLASQIALSAKNKNYNITHVHRGFSFELALLDAAMLLKEHPYASYLVGGADEISSYNYNIDWLAGWYKKVNTQAETLYTEDTQGTIAGEAAAMFRVNATSEGAIARLVAIQTIHSEDEKEVINKLKQFIRNSIPAGQQIDLLLSGENGDNRLKHYYSAAESVLSEHTSVLRYKHLSGEFPTSSAFATWVACKILETKWVPPEFVKRHNNKATISNLLVYNTFQGKQHSFILFQSLSNA